VIGPLQKKKKVAIMEALKNLKILWKDEVPPPLAHLYRLEGEDFVQNIWYESEALLGTHWEPREHIENLM
jgi:hypothetical protein